MIKDENRERELIRQIVHGNRIAMKRFYDDYSGYLTAVCARYISNEEEIKDVFLRYLKANEKMQFTSLAEDDLPNPAEDQEPDEEIPIADNKEAPSTLTPDSKSASKQPHNLQEPELLLAENRNEEITTRENISTDQLQ